jgi:hypothetical protein
MECFFIGVESVKQSVSPNNNGAKKEPVLLGGSITLGDGWINIGGVLIKK